MWDLWTLFGAGLTVMGITATWVLGFRPHWITNHLAHFLRLKKD